MIVVTGAAGFIGSNLVKALNARDVTDIIAVDDLSHGDKFINLPIARSRTISTRNLLCASWKMACLTGR